MHARARTCSPRTCSHSWPSVAMKRPSVAMRGHPWSSEAIRGHQRPSEVIRGNQRPSEAIRGHQRPSEAIRGHPWPSVAIISGTGSPHTSSWCTGRTGGTPSPSRAPLDADSQRSPAIRGNQRQSKAIISISSSMGCGFAAVTCN
jgi:hypothetical protein